MQHLFGDWGSFLADVRAAEHTLLLFDYDGTLTPIVSRPEEAVLSPGVRDKLRAIAARPAFTIGIISGRSLVEVKSMVGVSEIYYAGNHGLEVEGPQIKFIHPVAGVTRPVLRDLLRQLSAELSGIKGVIVEDKGLSLSVHYRLVSLIDEANVARIFQQVTAPRLRDGQIRVTPGKKVWEVRPPIDWDKGKAVETMVKEMRAYPGQGRLLPVYLGDDTTDEDAFRIVHRPQGWSIYVGGGK